MKELFRKHHRSVFNDSWLGLIQSSFTRPENNEAYKFSFPLEYPGSQTLITGPLAGVIFSPACFMYKQQNKIENAFRNSLTSIIDFFVQYSHLPVESQWDYPSCDAPYRNGLSFPK